MRIPVDSTGRWSFADRVTSAAAARAAIEVKIADIDAAVG
jgi:hypothetical protein